MSGPLQARLPAQTSARRGPRILMNPGATAARGGANTRRPVNGRSPHTGLNQFHRNTTRAYTQLSMRRPKAMQRTHTYTVVLLALFLVLVISAWPATAQTGLAGSAHDFTDDLVGGVAGDESWNATGEICKVCHVPHEVDPAFSAGSADAPLWNRELTLESFTEYADPAGSMDAVVGAPTGISLLCLGCHDGSIALESFGGNTAVTTTFATGSDVVGPDLSDDHPVSFTYDTALSLADVELEDPTTGILANGNTIDTYLQGGTIMQCSTCHDVHNAETDTVQVKLLRKSNAASDLCTSCHLK